MSVKPVKLTCLSVSVLMLVSYYTPSLNRGWSLVVQYNKRDSCLTHLCGDIKAEESGADDCPELPPDNRCSLETRCWWMV